MSDKTEDQKKTIPVGPLSPAERAALWRNSAGGLPHTKPLSDEAISRESIYADRG